MIVIIVVVVNVNVNVFGIVVVVVVFYGKLKTRVPGGKKPLEEGKESTANSTHGKKIAFLL